MTHLNRDMRSFHQFSRLPAELQTHVWDLVEPDHRVVEIRRHFLGMTQSGYYESHAKSLTSAPSVLHVCREARRVAIKNNLYQRAFVYGQSYVWINFAFDTISLKPFQCTYFVEESAMIQRLRIEDQRDDGSSFHYYKTQILHTFPSLKEINIICLDPAAHWVNILENCWLGTDNVTLSQKSDQSGRVYTIQELFEIYSAKTFAEYSDSETLQKFDARVKAPEPGAPKGLILQ